MTLAHVGKFMPEGIRALSSLMNMLDEAAAACKVSVDDHIWRDYFGTKLDGRKFWIGVFLSEPDNLSFTTECPISREAAEKLGIGMVDKAPWVKRCGYRWRRWVELDSEEIHFFSRSKVSQMQWLEGFLRECLAQARLIEVPNQPPLPADSERESDSEN